jgi:hypothetical protein
MGCAPATGERDVTALVRTRRNLRKSQYLTSAAIPLRQRLRFDCAQFCATPCIDVWCTVASNDVKLPTKSLKTRKNAQQRTTVVPTAKLSIVRQLPATNQQVACSSHAGRTILHKSIGSSDGSLPFEPFQGHVLSDPNVAVIVRQEGNTDCPSGSRQSHEC